MAQLRKIITDLRTASAAGDLAPAEVRAEARELADRLRADFEYLIAQLDELLQAGADQEPGVAFKVVATAGAVQGETRRARKRWRNRVWNTIWHELEDALRRIWSMISRLLTVKEWTLNGKIGNELFGLGQVGISVTFGK